MPVSTFNIRVYGILINNNNQVLITDELIKGTKITKFPGGGLEFGEGTIDCLKREFMEETNNRVEVVEHFYTTDYFQVSAYNPSHQIISIYYRVKPVDNFIVSVKQNQFDFDTSINEVQTFRWLDLNEISEHHFTLPIDKLIGSKLRENV